VVGISRLINNEKLILNKWRRILRTAVVLAGSGKLEDGSFAMYTKNFQYLLTFSHECTNKINSNTDPEASGPNSNLCSKKSFASLDFGIAPLRGNKS
jgi:hypothetical protein